MPLKHYLPRYYTPFTVNAKGLQFLDGGNIYDGIFNSFSSPGGPLKYSLEGHRFAVFACSLTSDKRYVVSVSNKFVSWDVASSETVRDIDPSASGMMMQMDLSKDNRYAVAFTR